MTRLYRPHLANAKSQLAQILDLCFLCEQQLINAIEKWMLESKNEPFKVTCENKLVQKLECIMIRSHYHNTNCHKQSVCCVGTFI